MAKLPNPPDPARLPAHGADVRVVPQGTALFRVYFLGGSYPGSWNGFRHYGPTNARFDHHLPPARVQTRGIMYLADQPVTCLAEVFQAKRRIDPTTSQPMLVLMNVARDLDLLDLTGYWPTRAGASMAISTGPRNRARLWAQAIYLTYPDLEGLYYASSMGAGRPCVALFERAAGAIPPHPVSHRGLSDPLLRPLLQHAAARLNYDLL